MHRVDFIQETIRQGLGRFTKDGALAVDTGFHTGRAATCRFIVENEETKNDVDWGKINQPVSKEWAADLSKKIKSKLDVSNRFSVRKFVGPYPVEVYSLSPWHALFADNMFRNEPVRSVQKYVNQNDVIRVFHDPLSKLSDYGLEFPSETAIVMDLHEMEIIVVGTAYAGEVKKAAFSMCNFKLPAHDILPMHASANCLEDGNGSSVLFGLSGTGKTTLSASPDRLLIGDDEIIWTASGISNLEGGCYAKLIDLDPKKEPQIYSAANKFGSILENVILDEKSLNPKFEDASRTENTRGSYPLESLPLVYSQNREAAAPQSIVFLTADAFGAMPAVAKLDSYQAQYHFISGYTAKVAGTELGVTEPQAAFSACFGAPFMPRRPDIYANKLAEMIAKTGSRVWLLNTGWMKGYGKSDRFPIHVSRQILSAIQSGELDQVEFEKHPIFGFQVPKTCPGVETKWLEIPNGEGVIQLASRFIENMKKFKEVTEAVLEKGGPTLS